MCQPRQQDLPHDGIVCCQRGSSSSGNSTGALPRGRAWCELLGARGTFSRAEKDNGRVSLLHSLSHAGWGAVQDPARGAGVGGFVPYQPSGECPGEAAHPLLMIFPPGGWRPAMAGGSGGGQLHLCFAPLPETAFASVPARRALRRSCSLQLAWSLNFTALAWSG